MINFDEFIKNGLLLKFPMPAFAKLFDTERYRASEIKFNHEQMVCSADDLPWFISLQFTLKNFYFLPITGVIRRMHANSESSVSLPMLQRVLYTLELCYKILCKEGVAEQYRYTFINYFVLHRVISAISAWKTLQERYQQLEECLSLLEHLGLTSIRRFAYQYNRFQCLCWQHIYLALFYESHSK